MNLLQNWKHYIGYGVLLLGLGLLVRFYYEEKVNLATAENKVKEQQNQIQSRDQAQAKKDALLDQKIKDINTLPKAQAVLQSTLKLKNVVGDVLTVSGADLKPDVSLNLPDAPQAKLTLLTTPQTVVLAQEELKCQKTEGDLSTCQSDKQNLMNQIKDLQDAAKGGSKWHRLVKAGKCLAVGAAGAGVGALIDRGSPARGAAIGSVGSAGACQIFF